MAKTPEDLGSKTLDVIAGESFAITEPTVSVQCRVSAPVFDSSFFELLDAVSPVPPVMHTGRFPHTHHLRALRPGSASVRYDVFKGPDYRKVTGTYRYDIVAQER